MTQPRRLHCAALPGEGGAVELDARAAHHARVLRLSAGAKVVLFDGRGQEAAGTIERLDADGGRCVVGPSIATAVGPEIVLCPCLAKGDKLEAVVRASTELGVRAIHPILSARSVARPNEDRAIKRVARLEAIAREAARQSGRARVPDVLAPASLAEVSARAPSEAARLVFLPDAQETLEAALPADAPAAWLLVGPEGGLSGAEMEQLDGWTAVGLGGGVLRAETAGIVVVALAAHRMGALAPGARA